jgi:hypothetical protein
VLLVLAALVGGLWIHSFYAGDALVFFAGGQGQLQAVGSVDGRVCIVLTNIAFGRERAWTALHLPRSVKDFAAEVDPDRLDVHPALGSAGGTGGSPLGDGFHGFSIATSGAGVFPELPDSKVAYVTFPHWAAVIALAGLTVWRVISPAARRRRRLTRGLCVHCGYDLRASPERCPECGAPAPAGASVTAA